MHYQKIFNIIILLAVAVLYYLYFMMPNRCEPFIETMTPESNEAVQNLASVYNLDNMKVTNLEVTGNLLVGGVATLGQWNIRQDRIGIPDRGDLHLAPDQWMRLKGYGKVGSGPADYNDQGFASRNNYIIENLAGPKMITTDTTIGIKSKKAERYLYDYNGDGKFASSPSEMSIEKL
jgi:hypothetical protein